MWCVQYSPQNDEEQIGRQRFQQRPEDGSKILKEIS